MRGTSNGICRSNLVYLLLLLLAGCPASSERRGSPLADAQPAKQQRDDDQPSANASDVKPQTAEDDEDEKLDIDGFSENGSDPPSQDETAVAAADARDADALAPMSAAHVAADEKTWPLFRGDAQSSGVARSALPEKLELLWKFSAEDCGFESTPAIVDGSVYVSDSYGKFFALDLETGEKKWEFEGQLGFSASPAVRDGRIYIGDLDGNVWCIDARTGDKIWGIDVEMEIGSSANFYQDNVIFGAEGGTLFCLKIADGAPVWKFSIDEPIRCSPTIVANRCFLAGCDGKLHIVDLDKGEAVGAVDIKAPTGATPAVHDSRAFFGTSDGTFFCVDWEQAEIVWTHRDDVNAAEIRSSAAVDGKRAVVGDRGRRVFAMNAESGEPLWEFLTRRNVDGSPVIVGERVFFGADDGVIYGVDKASGEEVWRHEAGGRFPGSPAVADGKLIIASEEGVVYCFGAKGKE